MDIECAYCEKTIDCSDYETAEFEEEEYEIQCPHCDKYIMTGYYHLKYWKEAEKVPCANGEGHDFKYRSSSYGAEVKHFKECICGEKIETIRHPYV